MMKPNWDDAPVEATHWCESKLEWRDETEDTISDCCIRIPDCEPAEPDWSGEGLPPVGCECEVLMGSYWHRCYVLGRSDEALWVKAHDRQDYWTIMNGPSVSVRPIRTKEQREREELQEIIEQYLDWGHSKAMSNDVVDAILSRYNLEPKP